MSRDRFANWWGQLRSGAEEDREMGAELLSLIGETAKICAEILTKAHEHKLDDVKKCEYFLRVIQRAIQGLENEYRGILVQARFCELGDPKQIQRLHERIHNYME